MRTQINHSNTKENRQHSSVLIPYSLYDCQIPDKFANVPAHWHEEPEFNFIERGNGSIIIDGETIPVEAGDLVMIPANILHAAFAGEGGILHYQAFVFHPAILGYKSGDRGSLRCILPFLEGTLKIGYLLQDTKENYPAIHQCITEILSAVSLDTALSDLLIKSSLLRLFYEIEKEPSLIQREDSKSTSSNLIRPALTYMDEHFKENITVEMLASTCNLSTSYFMSCFKKLSGTSSIEHLTQLRIMNACDDLVTTNDSIANIAFQNGFDNLSNFNRMFKKLVGITPNQYRHRGM